MHSHCGITLTLLFTELMLLLLFIHASKSHVLLPRSEMNHQLLKVVFGN